MNAQVVDDTDDDSVEKKNALIGQQLISLIQTVHQGMRPFILIFPSLEGDGTTGTQALTNISNVPYLRSVLKEHLKATKSVTEFDRIPTAALN